MRIFVILLCSLLSYNCLPTYTIQFKQLGVVGKAENEELVLVNGVVLTGYSENINNILRAISVDASLHQALSVDKLNQTLPKNLTLVRLRECKLVGSRVRELKDRVFYNGKDYLILNQATYRWMAREHQGLEVLGLWHQDQEYTKQETINLLEGCLNLIQELHPSKRTTGVMAVLAPVLAILAFLGLIILSLFASKRQGPEHYGGVLGSIIHYPRDITNVPGDRKDQFL